VSGIRATLGAWVGREAPDSIYPTVWSPYPIGLRSPSEGAAEDALSRDDLL